MDDDTVMKSSDLGVFLAYCDGKICLAIMEVTGLQFNDRKVKGFHTTAKFDDLAMQTSKITVVGQLIEIQQSDFHSESMLWEWPKCYVNLDSELESDLLTKQQFSLEIPSHLLHLLSQRIFQLKGLAAAERLHWTVATAELKKVLKYAWATLDPEGENITSHLNMLPKIKNLDAIPYRRKTGMFSVSYDLRNVIEF